NLALAHLQRLRAAHRALSGRRPAIPPALAARRWRTRRLGPGSCHGSAPAAPRDLLPVHQRLSPVRRSAPSAILTVSNDQQPTQAAVMAPLPSPPPPPATPDQFIAGLTDFGPGRSTLFPNSADEDLQVHELDLFDADVTEGSGGVWERLHYDWSAPR